MSRLPAALRGALWMVGALLSFSLMAVSVRELLRTMCNFEILFLRSLVSFVLVLAVAGILVILKPGLGVVHPAALVMLAGSFAYASTMIATKRLSGSDSALAVVFYMSVVQLPLAFVPALPGWVAPALVDLPWILAIGAAGLGAHYCLTRAMRIADATLVVPIDFLRLPLIAVVGMLFYGEPLEFSIMLGAAMIFAGTYYSVQRESRKPGRDGA